MLHIMCLFLYILGNQASTDAIATVMRLCPTIDIELNLPNSIHDPN